MKYVTMLWDCFFILFRGWLFFIIQECKKIFMVHMNERMHIATPNNTSLVAVPLFEIYNLTYVRQYLCQIPFLLYLPCLQILTKQRFYSYWIQFSISEDWNLILHHFPGIWTNNIINPISGVQISVPLSRLWMKQQCNDN